MFINIINQTAMITYKNFYFLVFLLMVLPGLASKLNAQNGNGNISTKEVPKISGGALFNTVSQLAKYSRTDYRINNVYKKFKAPPAAQSTTSSFDAIDFDGNASNSGYYSIPPDPNGAAGLNYLVNIVNTSIEWYTKTGTKINSISLQNFFSSLSPLTSCFDPKVIYDQYMNRFVVVALEQTDTSYGSPLNTSRFFLAVSKDDNPSGGWYFTAINSKLNISGKDYWADFPGLAVDSNAVYITSNIFSFAATGGAYGGTRLWIISKASFYSGGVPSVNIYDPQYAAGVSYVTMQPAHTYGTMPANSGTFLVSYSGLTDNTDDYVGIILINNPLTSPAFTNQYIDIGKIDNLNIASLPEAPQLGTSKTIDVGDRRSLWALWKNNSLWITTTVVPPSGADAGQTTAFWIRINTANSNLLVKADEGYIGGEDISPGTYTFYPSVAVDAQGNMGIGFSASSPTIYAGAYYAGRLVSDPPGAIDSSVVYRNGLDYYYRTFGGGSNRWGDYSGISIDPSDNSTFWVFNQYAITRGSVINSEDGRWGTAWAKFSLGKLPGSITVTSPNGGENWLITSVNNITWTSSNVANVKIDYSTNSGASWINIASNVSAASGIYYWTIPNTQTSSALVRVYDAADSTVGDTSNNVFSINPAPVIVLTSPIGGENWFIDSTYNVTWASSGIDSIKIELTTDGGTSWTNLVNSYPAVNRSFSWKVVSNISSQCKIRISYLRNPLINDVSHNNFTIKYNRIKGDVDGNGVLQAFDASLILRYYAGLIQLNDPASVWAADVNNDGTVSVYDASEVLNYVVNGIVPF